MHDAVYLDETVDSLLLVEWFALIYRAFAVLCHSLLKSTSQAFLMLNRDPNLYHLIHLLGCASSMCREGEI